MLTITSKLPKVFSWATLRSKAVESLVLHDARTAVGKFMKQEVPIFGTISWLPVAHLDGDERAEEAFDLEACKRAETFGEYVEARYGVRSIEARKMFLQIADSRWDDTIAGVLEERRERHKSQLANLLF